MFTGPLFVLGTARSGTTMLRELLVTHPEICISKREYPDLTKLLHKWSTYGDLSCMSNFKEMYKDAHNIVSIDLNKYFGDGSQPVPVKCVEWFSACKDFTPSGIFEALVRYHASVLDNKLSTRRIWGDKSPQNFKHIPLLIKMFPEAKFILLIRDPRDVALSLDKFSYRHYYKRFSKNAVDDAWECLQTVGNWRLVPVVKTICYDMLQAKEWLIDYNADFLLLKYEEILTDLSQVLGQIASFLMISNAFKLEEFQIPVLSYGAGSGENSILSTNLYKYKSLPPIIVRKINSISGCELDKLGYDSQNCISQKKLTLFVRKLYSFLGVVSVLTAFPRFIGVLNTIFIVYHKFLKKK